MKKTIILNENALINGIQKWFKHPKWDKDFHNQFYFSLIQSRKDEITMDDWNDLVNILWDWLAIRPKTKDFIRQRGLAVLPELNVAIDTLRQSQKIEKITIMNVNWNQAAPLFHLAKGIKGVESPVFASKLCHFLLPNVYPVIDNEYIGINGTYTQYWKECNDNWKSIDDSTKIELINILKGYIKGETEYFPWFTKIYELCLAGNNSKR